MQRNGDGSDGLAGELAIVAKVCKAEAEAEEAPLSTGDKCAGMVQARGLVCVVENCGIEEKTPER
jgi:hypothetical protein